MRKYCRYCAFCICGDAYYCTAHNKVLYNVKHTVQCSDFVLSELGDIDTGKQYAPRKASVSATQSGDLQLKLY